jgi:hypothetical protein
MTDVPGWLALLLGSLLVVAIVSPFVAWVVAVARTDAESQKIREDMRRMIRRGR